jgi:Uma2 family endonuclease
MIETLANPTMTPGSHLHLSGISWDAYSSLLEVFAESPGVRLTYVEGELEIMSPLFCHDNESRFFPFLVFTLAEEWELPYQHGGSTTLRRKVKRRGVEPDECFWIENADKIRGKRRIDLAKDPPPDLVVEVQETRSILDRVEIYGKLGVRELWRLNNDTLTFWKLASNFRYVKTLNSLSFPELTAKGLAKFVDRYRRGEEMIPIIKDFRHYVRKLR